MIFGTKKQNHRCPPSSPCPCCPLHSSPPCCPLLPVCSWVNNDGTNVVQCNKHQKWDTSIMNALLWRYRQVFLIMWFGCGACRPRHGWAWHLPPWALNVMLDSFIIDLLNIDNGAQTFRLKLLVNMDWEYYGTIEPELKLSITWETWSHLNLLMWKGPITKLESMFSKGNFVTICYLLCGIWKFSNL